MAELSDQLLAAAILAYLTAMVGYAAQYAFGARGPVARAVAAREPALTGAPPLAEGSPPQAGAGPGRPPRAGTPTGAPASGGQAALAGRIAHGALLAAVAVHLATVVTRGVAAGRMPWGNMYEFILTATLFGAVAWLVVAYRLPAVRHLGLYVSLVNVILLALAGMAFYTPVGPLVASLDSYWFVVHVFAGTLAAGIFLVGFVTAAMYLVRAGYEGGGRRFPLPLAARLPAAEVIERLTFRLHAFGFPIWTFAVAAGAIWAEAAWGRYWGWDAKEVWAFISWVVYAGYLHARATPSVRRNTAAWLAIAGWLTIMMNLFGVNLFFESLHSYA